MKIFISHSSKNKNYGNHLVELLRSLGVKENEIIFTSNVAYGIPVAKNIFNWLKSQIEEKPFVIYLLSKEYYESVACLNEMGAAWIVENEHAAIFTPNFNLSSKEFQNGALDPREIGFKINDEDRIMSFIQMLSKNFEITGNAVIISQSVKKFIRDIGEIKQETVDIKQVAKKVMVKETTTSVNREKELTPKVNSNSVKLTKGDLYSKFLGLIAADKLKQDELLLLHYIIDTSNVKLMTGWQEDQEVSKINEWEKINDIKDILSKNYPGVLRRFELRGFTEVSQVTSSGNPKEVKLKEEIAVNVLDLPNDVLSKIEEVVKNNFYEHPEEIETEDDYDLPF
ncbi:toll/interleukin-1 receptor domain-containing protein [Algibacter lectus]|uniref:Conserved domain protein n=1 Tax=Algibacter lectus TaxID=221126 RepID=A0A090V9T1_9FLAO|nr:toll/interleukin-1 receptor domain-containing protein [Algibacter lectus]GAL61575.1 conserved domain protein [Algibacter lectus]